MDGSLQVGVKRPLIGDSLVDVNGLRVFAKPLNAESKKETDQVDDGEDTMVKRLAGLADADFHVSLSSGFGTKR